MPLNFSMEIRGYNRVENHLRRLASDMEKELDPAMYAWAQDTRARLKSTPYPPKRQNQRYIRTGRFASSWRVDKTQDSRYQINNFARGPRGGFYAGYVAGDGQGQNQAWMHQGRWWIARDVIEGRMDNLRTRMIQRLVQVWESGSDY